MQYNYAYWKEEDAKAGLYTINSKVAYKSSDGIERVFKANEDYIGSIKPPDIDDTWDYVEDIVYDWDAGMKYKIGSVVNYNGLQYVATRRYRGGTAPPTDELDPDGIRTWMLNYEDGVEPVTPFFYKKTFGYKTYQEASAYVNFLEDIDHATIPYFFGKPDNQGEYSPDEIEPEFDRFYNQRNQSTWIDPSRIDRRPEQALANSVMEAHPYHDIYVFGETRWYGPANDRKSVFEWFPNAKHKSELRDKFFDYLLPDSYTGNFFIPKRTIPYWSFYFNYLFDGSSINQLTKGVSIEYYPTVSSSDIDIICPKYSRYLSVIEGPYSTSFYGGPASVKKITPLYVTSDFVWRTVPVGGGPFRDPLESTKMTIRIHPNNICVDSIKITFYFVIMRQNCWPVVGMFGQPASECSDPEYSHFQLTYDYNEQTRVASRDYSDTFKGKSYRWIDNPAYDPNCVPDLNTVPPTECPPQKLRIEDTNYVDTSIEMSDYLQTNGGTVEISLSGWSIS